MARASWGDADLVEQLAAAAGRHPHAAALATVTPQGARVACLGAPPSGDYEIGSVSKGLTGLLYVDAVDRGEVQPSTTLGELLPLGGSPAGELTLSSLTTHSSGLPRLALTESPLRRTLDLWRHGINPYRDDLQGLLRATRRVALGRPLPAYSNLGFQLLGHALAQAAGTDFAALVRDRLARPLGLETLYPPDTPADLRPEAIMGRSRRGRPQEPWTGEALAPAGGLRATVGDVARLVEGLLDGTAPGCRALDPVAPLGRGAEIGAAWVSTVDRGRTVTWQRRDGRFPELGGHGTRCRNRSHSALSRQRARRRRGLSAPRVPREQRVTAD